MVTLTIVVIVGYLAVGRAFAYIGLPSASIFLGEVLLVGAFLFRPLRDRILGVISQVVDGGPFHLLMWAITAFLGYGLLQVVYGKVQGYPILDILFNLPFNYYAMFVPIGIAIGALDAGLLPRLVRVLAWTNAIYGVVFLAVLQHLEIVLPWAQGVALTGPAGSALALLGLLCYAPDFRRDWYLYAANVFMLLAMQVRGEWLGFFAAFVLWSILRRNIRVMAAGIAIMSAIFGLMSTFGIQIAASSTRGGTISAQGVLARSIAPFNQELANRYSDQADVFAGTASWRETWWQAIGQSVTADGQHLAFGHGYGFELRSLVSYVEPGVRTPHSVYYYAIGYSGFLGLTIFLTLQVAILTVLNRVRRLTGDVFGMMVVVAGFGLGMFGNHFETPFGAIPYYLLVGLCLSPLLRPASEPGGRAAARTFAVAGARRTVQPSATAAALTTPTGSDVVEPVPAARPPESPPAPAAAIAETSTSAAGPAPTPGLPPTFRTRMQYARDVRDNLRSRTAADLRRLARHRGIPSASRMKKAKLVTLIAADLDRELRQYEDPDDGDG